MLTRSELTIIAIGKQATTRIILIHFFGEGNTSLLYSPPLSLLLAVQYTVCIKSLK